MVILDNVRFGGFSGVYGVILCCRDVGGEEIGGWY